MGIVKSLSARSGAATGETFARVQTRDICLTTFDPTKSPGCLGRIVIHEASRTSNSILTSSLALTPAFPGGLIPKSVCFTMDSPV